MDLIKNNLHDCWIDLALADNLKSQGRYIKVEADSREGNLILCDELLINPQY